MSISFKSGFDSNVISGVSYGDVTLVRNDNADKASAQVKVYSNAFTALFGRLLSFIWHNSDNKQIKAMYIADVIKRIGGQTRGRAEFIKSLNNTINANSGTPLQARVVCQIEADLKSLKGLKVKVAPSQAKIIKAAKHKQAIQVLETTKKTLLNLEKAFSPTKSYVSPKNIPNITALKPYHQNEILKFVAEKGRCSNNDWQIAHWNHVHKSLEAQIK